MLLLGGRNATPSIDVPLGRMIHEWIHRLCGNTMAALVAPEAIVSGVVVSVVAAVACAIVVGIVLLHGLTWPRTSHVLASDLLHRRRGLDKVDEKTQIWFS
ncbi:Aste57867_12084 [Aphanomyces stellatus]|uniref:Aste57867_12084 protein n=1 Tax=Aphanomyces stellatus TaxID=120398 RepID=A0A485KV83_9STRA|nr:hypothetical protein As57867_012039 [Aphanomyces stellatus]VFT88939.1 Aste57867_12084 [Aphanomyces stellatus]